MKLKWNPFARVVKKAQKEKPPKLFSPKKAAIELVEKYGGGNLGNENAKRKVIERLRGCKRRLELMRESIGVSKNLLISEIKLINRYERMFKELERLEKEIEN